MTEPRQAPTTLDSLNDPVVRRLRLSAALGGLMWLAFAAAPGMNRVLSTEALLLWLGMFSVVPLALSTIPRQNDPPGRLLTIASRLHSPASALAALSWLFIPGPRAAWFTTPWLLFCLLVALSGFLRILERGLTGLGATIVDVACIYLPVGGIWLAASRHGSHLMGFSEPIVLLTAVHFHFAGLVAPLVVAQVGRYLPRSPTARRLHQAASILVLFGVPLTALGINGSRTVELAAASALAFGMTLYAVLVLFFVDPHLGRDAAVSVANSRSRTVGTVGRWLLRLSALSLFLTMAFAVAYAYGRLTGREVFSMAAMVKVHGVTNAAGFALAATLALCLVSPPRG